MDKSVKSVALATALLLGQGSQAMSLSSPAFEDGAVIPDAFAFNMAPQCSGGNQSPPLVFGQLPAGTRSLALTVFDPDGGNWLHWKAWNIAGSTLALPANAAVTQAQQFQQARNDFGTQGWGGPCPPTPQHRYLFTLYALNTTFDREPGLDELRAASLQTATLTGKRSPSDRLAWSAPNRQACLFHWLERQFPAFVAPRAPATVATPAMDYRFYSQTQSYLGYDKQDQHLYYLSTPTGLIDLGAASAWTQQAACP